MSWWLYLLISIGAYLVSGVITAMVVAYIEGRHHGHYKAEEYGWIIFVWPVLLAVGLVFAVIASIEAIHKRGASYETRKEAKTLTRGLREIGIDPKKVK